MMVKLASIINMYAMFIKILNKICASRSKTRLVARLTPGSFGKWTPGLNGFIFFYAIVNVRILIFQCVWLFNFTNRTELFFKNV